MHVPVQAKMNNYLFGLLVAIVITEMHLVNIGVLQIGVHKKLLNFCVIQTLHGLLVLICHVRKQDVSSEMDGISMQR